MPDLEEIAATIGFAAAQGLPFSVRGGGHSMVRSANMAPPTLHLLFHLPVRLC